MLMIVAVGFFQGAPSLNQIKDSLGHSGKDYHERQRVVLIGFKKHRDSNYCAAKRQVGGTYRTERGSAGSYSQLKIRELIRPNHNHPNLTLGSGATAVNQHQRWPN
jgi:hypothetical protein